MKKFDTTAMGQATDAVRAGDLMEATRLIQAALGNGSGQGCAPGQTNPLPQRNSLPDMNAMLKGLPRGGAFNTRMPSFKPRLKKGARRMAHGMGGESFSCDAGSRDYVLHLPKGREAAPTGLVMMLHGCTQNPHDFAAGTGMNALADRHGFAVVYPGQSREANMQSCWNWFNPVDQQRAGGEPEILAGLAQKIVGDRKIPMDKVFVAGLSAGAAMAVILGQTHGDIFAGVGVHSGLPYGVATDVASAFGAMGNSAAQGGREKAKRTIVFHGTADGTVHPANGDAIAARQVELSGAVRISEEIAGARNARRDVVRDENGVPVLEHWVVNGLGHAWSGGRSEGSYTDPEGPDASAAMVRFFFNDVVK